MAVKIGKPANVYFSFVVNLLIVLVVVAEAISTRFRNGLPRFISLDTKSTIPEASAGVTALSDAVDARIGGAADWGAGAVRVVVGGRK